MKFAANLICYCVHTCIVLSFEFLLNSDFSSERIMQDLPNMDAGDVQPPANLQEIHQCASNFRKLMLLFPYVHPAALHGVIVKHSFNWEQILPLLFAGQDARAEQFWDEVNGHKELEQALQRYGVRLVCCNGFRENQCFGLQSLDDLTTCAECKHEADSINIVIEQNPPRNGEKVVPKAGCEVETQYNDVIRIILGQNTKGSPRTLEIVRNDSADGDQPGYIIRNVTNTSESTAKEVPNVKKPRRTAQRAGATKVGEKKSRSRKPKVTNEQPKTCSVDVGQKPATGGSKKGKASNNTRVKSSKNTTSTH